MIAQYWWSKNESGTVYRYMEDTGTYSFMRAEVYRLDSRPGWRASIYGDSRIQRTGAEFTVSDPATGKQLVEDVMALRSQR